MAMAIRIFPSLNIPPKSPGRPKGTVRGQSLWACAALAERYDTFTDELRRKHPGMPDHATMTAFVRRNPEILKPFQKGIESPETLSIHTLHKKIAIGKKYYRLVDMHNVLSEPQILIEALSYMPFSEHLSFKRELLELDAGTEDGKSRILQIAKEVAHAVPSRISYGPVAFNPYWKRRSVK